MGPPSINCNESQILSIQDEKIGSGNYSIIALVDTHFICEGALLDDR
jgi:hypothetical protein